MRRWPMNKWEPELQPDKFTSGDCHPELVEGCPRGVFPAINAWFSGLQTPFDNMFCVMQVSF